MDNTQYYGAVSRFFHWTMAAAFAFMLFTAIQFKQENYSWMGAHKTTGFVLTILVALRVIWAAMKREKPPAWHAAGETGTRRHLRADDCRAGDCSDSPSRFNARRFGCVRHDHHAKSPRRSAMDDWLGQRAAWQTRLFAVCAGSWAYCDGGCASGEGRKNHQPHDWKIIAAA